MVVDITKIELNQGKSDSQEPDFFIIWDLTIL